MNKFVVVDLETTGNSPKKGDRIIQFAAVVIENGNIVRSFHTFLNPNVEIPTFISELTNITDDMVRSSPQFYEIADEVESLLRDSCFVAHNVYFDLAFLQAELEACGRKKFSGPVIDTVELTKILMPTLDSYKLSDIAFSVGFNHSRPHRADSDAKVTAQLFLNLLKKMNQLPFETIQNLEKLSKGLKSDLSLLLQQVLQQKNPYDRLNPNLVKKRNLIIRKDVEDGIINPNIEHSLKYPFNHEEKRDILKKGFTHYEERHNQLEMMNEVWNSLVNEKISFIEAGAGLGKTIGYLIPAAYFSEIERKKVVISVSTIQLQHQIMENEIPRLLKMIPFTIVVAMLKGRQNYLSLWKFEKLLFEKNEHYDETITKMQILVWLTETLTGDVDELNLSSGGKTFWRKVCSEIDINQTINPWKSMEFYYRAKEKAKNANIIITNHHFLLADTVNREQLLPPYDYLIIDEAHHFENAGTNFFGHRFEYNHIRFLISRFGTLDSDYLLSKIKRILLKHSTSIQEEDISDKQLLQFAEEADELFRICSNIVQKYSCTETQAGKLSMYLKEYNKTNSSILYSCERVYDCWKRVSETFDEWNDLLEELYSQLKDFEKVIVDEWFLYVHDFIGLGDALKDFIQLNSTQRIHSIETDVRSTLNQTSLNSHYLFPGQALYNYLFSKKKSIIFTSATMTVNHDFRFFKEQIGLLKVNASEKQYPSPFDYENQTKVFILNDLPDVTEVDMDDYSEAISSHITSITEATKGRLVILFTSYEMMKKTYFLIKDSQLLEDYVLLAQGISGGSQHRLMKHFQQFNKAVLFGTGSFWEGMDIPGEALSALIIVRLPFSSPQEPVNEARSQAIRRQGKNPFYEYSLPEAILRFKQGFGRIIRTDHDKGCFIVFDKRILTNRYGKKFIQSIPVKQLHVKNIDEVCYEIEKWFG